jgi:hypothetical protein
VPVRSPNKLAETIIQQYNNYSQAKENANTIKIISENSFSIDSALKQLYKIYYEIADTCELKQ